MKRKSGLVHASVLALSLIASQICGRGLDPTAQAATLQPWTSVQDGESPQLHAAEVTKRIEDIDDLSVAGTAKAAQYQQLQNGKPESDVAPASTPGFCTWHLNRNQYFISVPSGVSNLRFTLTGSPSNSDVDLAVRFNQPVDIFNGQLIADYVSRSSGGFEEISINFPSPGNWFVAVGNCELFPVPFTLVASHGCSSILQLDDGGFENIVGYLNGASRAYFINRITPPSYPATLTSVLIYFPPDKQSLPPGFPITILASRNPGGSSYIYGHSFEQQVPETVRFTGGFNEYRIEPVTIYSGDFLVGFVTYNPPNTGPVAYDITFPRGRSYTSTDGFDFRRVEEFNTVPPGNFGIRGRIQGCRPLIFPSFAPQAVSGFVPRGGVVEYEFDPVSGARYRFSTCDGFAAFDTVIEVIQYGWVLASNDNGCFSRGSTLEVSFSSSTRATVRVRGAFPSSTGNFTMVYRRVF